MIPVSCFEGRTVAVFGLGRTAAYDLTHRPGFPSPVPVSRNAYRWWASEVAAFTAALRVESQHSSGSRRRQTQRRTSPQEVAHLRITGKMRAARNRRPVRTMAHCRPSRRDGIPESECGQTNRSTTGSCRIEEHRLPLGQLS